MIIFNNDRIAPKKAIFYNAMRLILASRGGLGGRNTVIFNNDRIAPKKAIFYNAMRLILASRGGLGGTDALRRNTVEMDILT